MSKRLVINADDFGYTDAITDGILAAVRDGVVTSTTLLCCRRAAAERAVRLSREAPSLGLGLHLNLSEGAPAASADEVPLLLGADGRLGLSPLHCLWRTWARRRMREQVRREWAAQIEWFIARAGRPPTHLDSHKHVHAIPPLFRIACELAGDYGVRFIRPVNEPLWRGSLLGSPGHVKRRRQLRQLVASQAVRWTMWSADQRTAGQAGLRSADRLFGPAQTGCWTERAMELLINTLPQGLSELMVHPGLADDAAVGRIARCRPMELATLTAPGLRERIASAGIVLTNYGEELARSRETIQPATV